jgi:S-DNA-T family DNA segregation ATPase FtsK/SpoIIIE
MLDSSIEVVRQTGQASVSILQRKLKIGYSRAARIMDTMEEKGLVGPYRGTKPREILMETYADEARAREEE